MKYLNAIEIRVGNNVSFNNDDIKLDGSLFAMYLQNELDKPFYPIKLSDKWLTDFGFTKTEWDNNNSFRKMVGNNDYTIVFYSNCVCEIGDIITKEIEFVHQLQNLYYALTGVELSVS